MDEFGNQADYTRSLLQETDEGGWHIYSAYQINVIDRIGNGHEEPCVQGNFNYEKNSYRIKVEMKMPGGGTVAFVRSVMKTFTKTVFSRLIRTARLFKVDLQ